MHNSVNRLTLLQCRQYGRVRSVECLLGSTVLGRTKSQSWLVIQSSVIDFLQSHHGNTLKQTIYVMYPGLATLSSNYIIRISVPTFNTT